ncbi:hypothetical protein C6P97_02535 [Burkholderia multivorans]|uniref:Uncharacterized protein n=1 Tax=Burkholderia multivorans TaxID=87883 RepID=A0AB37AT51_9BURK|nr:hypothetical protein C6P99_13860 [Burkholderia multivorans]PRE54974.1 hypothetical protein C6P97_02535 [Burkholderia multivorans]
MQIGAAAAIALRRSVVGARCSVVGARCSVLGARCSGGSRSAIRRRMATSTSISARAKKVR